MTFSRGVLLFLCCVALSPDNCLAEDEDSPVERLVSLGIQPDMAGHLVARWQALTMTPPADSLVQAMIDVVQRRRAPVDLVVDKVSEGLAKRVSPQLLLPALDRWGRELSQASEVSRRLHNRFDAGTVSMRETVLRLHLLRRGGAADVWLRQLFLHARESDLDVGTFLRVCEAVAQLQDSGLQQDPAVAVGQRWLAAGVPAGDVGHLVRAIEDLARDTSLVAAAKWVTDRTAEDWSAKAIVERVEQGGLQEIREHDDATDVSGNDTVADDSREGIKAGRTTERPEADEPGNEENDNDDD
jgi:hypothetical protein